MRSPPLPDFFNYYTKQFRFLQLMNGKNIISLQLFSLPSDTTAGCGRTPTPPLYFYEAVLKYGYSADQ